MLGRHTCTIFIALLALGACSVYDSSLLSTNQRVASSGTGGVTGIGGDATTLAGSGGTVGQGEADAGGNSGETVAGATSSNGGAAGSADAGSASVAGTGGSAGTSTGGGGAVDTAGSAGAAGSLALDSIDDMEDDDALISYDATGRNGDWYVGHDATATGTQFPGATYLMSALDTTDSRYAVSKYAAHTYGIGFTDWGENMGFNLKLVDQTLGKHPPYDASAYCGLHFFGKIGAGASAAVIFRVPDKNSHPDGGVCGAADKPCYLYYQKQYSFSSSWTEYSVLFSALTRSGWPATFAQDAIFGVEFGLLPNSKFELWVDDISFLKKPASGVCPSTLE
ncbi:MAG TPA: hypothetical protein VGM44_07050 [Polyangiaceae bacterium]|jgi:hypothetical protein